MMRINIDMEKLDSLWFHLVFWAIYFGISFSIFIGLFNIEHSVLRVLANAATHALLIYVVLYLLIPKFFMTGWYILHYALVAILIGFTTVFRVNVDSWLNGPAGIIPVELFSTVHYAEKALSALIIVGICHSLKFAQFSWQQQRKEAAIQKQNLEAELKLLKAQVNPHFLFNTLNNIYAHAYSENKAIAAMVLQLSNLMRYMLYDSNEKLVPLNKEVEYLHNYFALQKIKTSNNENFSFEVTGNLNNVQIAPMLLIPFFENAFKHGIQIKGLLTVNHGEIYLNVNNAIQPKAAKDKTGGIGLGNVKKRLSLLYPQKHTLEINDDAAYFKVNLKIQTK